MIWRPSTVNKRVLVVNTTSHKTQTTTSADITYTDEAAAGFQSDTPNVEAEQVAKEAAREEVELRP